MNKNIRVWNTRDGRNIRICDMDYEHLQNLLTYLTRRKFEWEHAKLHAQESGRMIGPLTMQDIPISTWINEIEIELEKIAMAKLESAVNVMKSFNEDYFGS